MPVQKRRAIKSEKLSKPGEERFVIIDPDTGEILDDADGYGYKTPQEAHESFGYASTNSDPMMQAEERIAKAWWDKHEDFKHELEDEIFYILEDEIPFTFKDFKTFLIEENQDTNGINPRILWRHYK